MRNYLPHAIIFFCATFVWYATTHENDEVVNFLLVVFICCLFAYFNYSDLTEKKSWVEDYEPITVFEKIEPEPIIKEISEEEKAYNKALRASYVGLTWHNERRLQEERDEQEKAEKERQKQLEKQAIIDPLDNNCDMIFLIGEINDTPPEGFTESSNAKFLQKKIK